MMHELHADAWLDVLAADSDARERETLEWLALEPSRLRDLVRLALLDESTVEA